MPSSSVRFPSDHRSEGVSTMLSRTSLLKPAAPTLKEYRPGTKALIANSPLESVCVTRSAPVVELTSFNCASWTAARELSKTEPNMEPVMDWAVAVARLITRSNARQWISLGRLKLCTSNSYYINRTSEVYAAGCQSRHARCGS